MKIKYIDTFCWAIGWKKNSENISDGVKILKRMGFDAVKIPKLVLLYNDLCFSSKF